MNPILHGARAALFCTAALLCAVSPQALAKVEVEAGQSKSLGSVLIAKISEDIAPGDYEALLKGLRANPGKYNRKIVMLDSIGGSVNEAIRMGRLLRETGFHALVATDDVCQGSCVYLLAAGHSKTVRGAVGLHRPYFPQGDSVHSAHSAASRISPAMYLRDMGVSPLLLADMQSIAPAYMRVLSVSDLRRYRLN